MSILKSYVKNITIDLQKRNFKMILLANLKNRGKTKTTNMY